MHIPFGYSMPAIWGFDHIKSKDTWSVEKDYMKRFWESLREHAKSIIDFQKKIMLPLTREELKSYEESKVCYICRKYLIKKYSLKV